METLRNPGKSDYVAKYETNAGAETNTDLYEIDAISENTDTTTSQASADTTSAEDESKDEGVEVEDINVEPPENYNPQDLDQPD